MMKTSRHRYNQRGIAMVGYAVLLAFATGIGGYFMIDPDGLGSAVGGKVETAADFLGSGSTNPRYSNTSEGFVEFSRTMVAWHNANQQPYLDTALRRVFKADGFTECKFSDLTAQQKQDLAEIGLDVRGLSGSFYIDDKGRWYAAWTDQNAAANEGKQVKTMVTSLSGSGDDQGVYVGYATVTNGSITNNRARYETLKGSALGYKRYGITVAKTENAIKQYDSMAGVK